jgi:hypothetical protein
MSNEGGSVPSLVWFGILVALGSVVSLAQETESEREHLSATFLSRIQWIASQIESDASEADEQSLQGTVEKIVRLLGKTVQATDSEIAGKIRHAMTSSAEGPLREELAKWRDQSPNYATRQDREEMLALVHLLTADRTSQECLISRRTWMRPLVQEVSVLRGRLEVKLAAERTLRFVTPGKAEEDIARFLELPSLELSREQRQRACLARTSIRFPDGYDEDPIFHSENPLSSRLSAVMQVDRGNLSPGEAGGGVVLYRVAALRMLEDGVPVDVAILEDGRGEDPENALYDLIQAAYWFRVMESEKGFRFLERAFRLPELELPDVELVRSHSILNQMTPGRSRRLARTHAVGDRIEYLGAALRRVVYLELDGLTEASKRTGRSRCLRRMIHIKVAADRFWESSAFRFGMLLGLKTVVQTLRRVVQAFGESFPIEEKGSWMKTLERYEQYLADLEDPGRVWSLDEISLAEIVLDRPSMQRRWKRLVDRGFDRPIRAEILSGR